MNRTMRIIGLGLMLVPILGAPAALAEGASAGAETRPVERGEMRGQPGAGNQDPTQTCPTGEDAQPPRHTQGSVNHSIRSRTHGANSRSCLVHSRASRRGLHLLRSAIDTNRACPGQVDARVIHEENSTGCTSTRPATR